MPKIIFEINYNIYPEKRDEYLETISELRKNINDSSSISYSIFENKKTKNNFTEMYICESDEEYEGLEDNQSDEVIALTQKLFDEFIKDNKVNYSTKVEV